MYVSMNKKDNKMVIEHKSNDNLKQNITRILEFRLEISLRTENNRTEENNKMMFPNEESQDEWGT